LSDIFPADWGERLIGKSTNPEQALRRDLDCSTTADGGTFRFW